MSDSRTYTNGTLVVEAVQFTGNFDEIEQFVGGDAEFRDRRLLVASPQGPLWAYDRDWICKKYDQFYVLDDETFSAIYRRTNRHEEGN